VSSPVMYAFSDGVSPLKGGAIAPGNDGFYLTTLTDGKGNPRPSGQLETVRTTEVSGNVVTVTEQAGTGLVKTGETTVRKRGARGWYSSKKSVFGLQTIVATRVYSHPKGDSEATERAKAAAPWITPSGEVAAVWEQFVLVSEAAELGFAIPAFHLGNRHWHGARGVGHAHGLRQPAQQALTAATVSAVENEPSVGDLPPVGDVL
jgi:hypothetical protein